MKHDLTKNTKKAKKGWAESKSLANKTVSTRTVFLQDDRRKYSKMKGLNYSGGALQ